MPKTPLRLASRPLLDLVSYGRAGPQCRLRLSADQIAAIDRTVRRVPEVMVKVLPKDSNTPRSAMRHLNYIGRDGKLELETDDGAKVQGKDAGERLLEDWDLDLDAHRKDMDLAPVKERGARLVHKVVLSMPAGTPSTGVLQAARNFAREEFGLIHRYALVLHIDDPHPHVHLVVKAMSEQGRRLEIGPATLRAWRHEFARHLSDFGIAANATERAVRGKARANKRDGIYRASLRGDSNHARDRTCSVAGDLREGNLRRIDSGRAKLLETRKAVEVGWRAVAELLMRQGHSALAAHIEMFTARMPPPRTEKEMLAGVLSKEGRASLVRDGPTR